MKDTARTVDPLPDTFATEEEAGDFWDTHSTMDYEAYLEPADDVIAIEQRIFEIPVAEDVFRLLQQEAQNSEGSISTVVDRILRGRLPLAEESAR